MDMTMQTRMRTAKGFIAALDQSGGSTPKALRLYGIGEDAYASEDEMFDLMHQMRARIITSPSFTSERVIAAILFEMTMDRTIEGKGTAEYLWEVKGIVPFLKVDKGLASEEHGVQLMKEIPDLDALCSRAVSHGVFGTKMRSVIKDADPKGIHSIVDQQFDLARQIQKAGLVPIIEPEVDIRSPHKAEAEQVLRAALMREIDLISEPIMLKLTIPSENGLYSQFVNHPHVLRVAALSGGYSRDEANERLAHQPGVIASFSRALTEGLSAQQSDAEFDAALDESIASIYKASVT